MNEACLGNAKQASIELKTLLVCCNLDMAIQTVKKNLIYQSMFVLMITNNISKFNSQNLDPHELVQLENGYL